MITCFYCRKMKLRQCEKNVFDIIYLLSHFQLGITYNSGIRDIRHSLDRILRAIAFVNVKM
jgi:hypothetical protein